MALVSVPPFSLYQLEDSSNGSSNAVTIDANSEATAHVFHAPKTGTIDRICFKTATVTTGDTLTISLQTVDTSGNPSGTLWGTNTSATQVVAAADDNVWFEVTLTAGASVTRGDLLACVVSMPSSGTVGNMNIQQASVLYVIGFPYIDSNNGTWAKASTRLNIGSIRYSDSTYPRVPGLHPQATGLQTSILMSTAWQNGSTPDERGNKITIPFACKVCGVWSRGDTAPGGAWDFKLYDVSDNVLASKSWAGSFATGSFYSWYMFGSEVTLAANDVVRLTRVPTTATTTKHCEWVIPSSAFQSACPMGANVFQTQRTDGGAWTDDTSRYGWIGLIISAVDDGVSAGGGGSSADDFFFFS